VIIPAIIRRCIGHLTDSGEEAGGCSREEEYLGNDSAHFFGMRSIIAAHTHDLGAHLHQFVAQIT